MQRILNYKWGKLDFHYHKSHLDMHSLQFLFNVLYSQHKQQSSCNQVGSIINLENHYKQRSWSDNLNKLEWQNHQRYQVDMCTHYQFYYQHNFLSNLKDLMYIFHIYKHMAYSFHLLRRPRNHFYKYFNLNNYILILLPIWQGIS